MARVPVQERRSMLVDAALRVITRDGVAHATTRAIAEEAGASLASFHYAFDSRTELLTAVLNRIIDSERLSAMAVLAGNSAVAPEPTQAPESTQIPGGQVEPQWLIKQGLLGYFDWLQKSPMQELSTLEITVHALRSADFDTFPAQLYANYLALLRELFDEIPQRTGRNWQIPVADVARFTLLFLDGLTISWLAERDNAQAQRMIDLAVQSISAWVEKES